MSFLKKMQDQTKAGNGNRQYNTFGVILSLETATKTQDGSLELVGTVLNNNKQLGEQEAVTVRFRGDNASRSVTNFEKGLGRTALSKPDAVAGAFLTIESCYVTEDMDGERRVLSGRWLNTLAAPGVDAHQNRSFIEGILASAPKISFKNPDVQPGEPERISLPVNADKFSARVKTDRGTFEKDFDAIWAVDKLNRLGKGDKPTVTIDTVEPNEAVVVADKNELTRVLSEQLGRGTSALSILRVTDGEDVFSRAVYVNFKKDGDEYVPDVEKTLENLFANNIFKGVPNEDLFAGLAAESIKVEAVPGYRLSYAGDPTKDDNASYKLIDDVKKGRNIHYQQVFGKEAQGYASVILPGIARNDSISGFSPINILAGDPGVFRATQFPTPNIQPAAEPLPRVAPTSDDEPEPGKEFDSEMEDDEGARPRP
ncbi:hypothetical protein [Burkholderia vietnamiensis]|uniref:hypothetical protein n=1 Tax=Burkholderia vietnamiensis TaxID=60552 RepID=UPI0007553F89|nr:hypothetical protein [Burkholderia vietnamiensis]KVR89537.1 hypothetical protein WK28_24320 [Burkholderia vietnamiensis]